MKILLFTAPMVQINTPYPSVPHLVGFLRAQVKEHEVVQVDPAIDFLDRIFSPSTLEELALKVRNIAKPSDGLAFFLDAFDDYVKLTPIVLQTLRGETKEFQRKIILRDLLPEGPRFLPLHQEIELQEKLQELQPEEKVQYLCSLFLDDLADYFRLGDDTLFEFSRYGEKLAASQASFSPLATALEKPPTISLRTLKEIAKEYAQAYKPDLVGISIPFSGTVFSALAMGKVFKNLNIPVALGGGYANTELRSLSEPRIFDYVDYITLDDGELPLLRLIQHREGKIQQENLVRTYVKENGKVKFLSDANAETIPFRSLPAPDYEGLPLKKYIPMVESLNPVHRLWTGKFWNKLILAHGCYWKKCTFCDTKLPYIADYQTQEASLIVDKMVKIAGQTCETGFHFVDEAAPPALLKSVAEELIKRNLSFTWWGNIRFDKSFTLETAQLLKKAGCLAVTGGLEVASPRLLEKIQKGITLEQVAKVTQAFQESGIFVHAYLMYGFPSETIQETVDSLEVVRQLFSLGCLQSAFWHRFAATVHSPVGNSPGAFGIALQKQNVFPLFSENDLSFQDSTGVDHDPLGVGLRAALFNYMHGVGLEVDVRNWFPVKVPKTSLSPNFVENFL